MTQQPLKTELAYRSGNEWPIHLGLVAAGLGGLGIAYAETFASMIDIWWRSETFTHGFLIFPITLFLIWRLRAVLKQRLPQTDVRALLPLLGLGFTWLVAKTAGVLVIEQLAVVAMIPTLVWLVMGFQVTRLMAFPLLFLVFAVPMGEALITPMMNMTAFFVVEAIRLTGIPIYATGTYFSLPSGDWSVVEGCSGVRYLIASITLGTLFAYLNYSSYRKRALFIIASALLPIVANWLRAFLIVMLGHWSDMKIAAGVDHLIYGWVFFGGVIFLLFWIGAYWRDPQPQANRGEIATVIVKSQPQAGVGRLWASMAVASLLVWPLWFQLQSAQAGSERVGSSLELPAMAQWQPTPLASIDWAPDYLNPTLTVQREYLTDKGTVGLYIVYYAEQRQDAELINSQNLMIRQKHPVWQQLQQQTYQAREQGQPANLLETHLKSARQDLLIWHWHELGGFRVNNPYIGKLIEAGLKISGQGAEGVAYVIYTTFEVDRETARGRLQHFIDQALPKVRQSIETQL